MEDDRKKNKESDEVGRAKDEDVTAASEAEADDEDFDEDAEEGEDSGDASETE